MADLPVLVVHGALIGKLLLAVVVALTLHAWAAWRRRGARRTGRTVAAEHGLRVETTALAPGPRVLRGIVRGGVLATWHEPQALVLPDDALAGSPYLDVNGDQIAITGPLTVLHGAGGRRRWLSRRRFERVGSGVEVIASGQLARPAGETDYREAARWTLSPLPDSIVVAVRPDARGVAPGAVRLLVAAAFASAVWYGLLSGLGHTLAWSVAELPMSYRIRDLSCRDPAVIAAALPGSRARALEVLRDELVYNIDHSETRDRQLAGLQEVAGECPLYSLLEGGMLEDALPVAERCGNANDVRVLRSLLGLYAEADATADAEADRDPASRAQAVTLHILTDHPGAAAAAADLAVADRIAQPSWRARADEAVEVAGLRCVTQLLHARAGSRPDFAHVPDRERSALCAAAAAVARPADHDALTALTAVAVDAPVARDVAAALGGPLAPDPRRREAPSDLVLAMDSSMWLAPAVLASHPGASAAELVDVRASLARLALYRGDLAAARREQGTITGLDAHATAVRTELAITIGERAGERPVEPALSPDRERRAGDTFISALHQAVSGDGGPLAQELRGHTSREVPTVLFAVIPAVTRNRAELVDALRTVRPEVYLSWTVDCAFGGLDTLVGLRDLARVAGDTERAASWQAIVDRRLAPLADRDRLLTLLLWQATHTTL